MSFKTTIILFLTLLQISCRSKEFNSNTGSLETHKPAMVDSLIPNNVSHNDSIGESREMNYTSSIFIIDFEKALKAKKQIKLSDIARNVQYVPLETDSNCLIGRDPYYYFADDLIFVSNINHVLVFDLNGKFLRKIGIEGKGPNEINHISTVSIMREKRIISLHSYMDMKLLFYSFNGDFIESIDVPMMEHIYALNTNKFIYYDQCIGGREDCVFRLTSRKNDTISFVSNTCKWVNNSYTAYAFYTSDFHPSYQYKKRFHFKNRYNDTVFTVINSKIVPAYCIQLGKYKVPDNLRPENPATNSQFISQAENYYYAYSLECDSLIFVNSNNYKEKDQYKILYETHSGNEFHLVNNFNQSSGILNNWDGGPEFWPEGIVNDNTLFMAVSPIKLKELAESEEFRNGTADEKNRKSLTELAGRLKEDDNAVVMIVTLK